MKKFSGLVISNKMDKTITVKVVSQYTHPKYKKVIKKNKNYLVHDAKNQAKINDRVIFAESKPISKRKRFRLLSIIDQVNQTPAKKAINTQ